jgi:ATP-dependent RNA helicase RhlE
MPIRCLVLTPTRELALQVEESVRTYGASRPIRSTTIYGGVGFDPQVRHLRAGPEIVVATPGRLLDHAGQGTIDLGSVEILVLDEADRMLDMGFIRDIRRILSLLPARRQNLLFSATFSNEIRDLAGAFLNDPAQVQIARRNAPIELVRQVVYPVDRERKRELLSHLIRTGRIDRALVFTRTKHGANRLAEQLERDGIVATAIHGNKSQGQRERALKAFRDGDVKTLIATDVAARGIDIPAVSHVYNYDLPEVPDAYVHRIGRTARAGRDGIAIAFCAPDETRLLRDIERLMNINIAVASGEAPANMNATPRRGNSNGNSNGNGGNRGQGRGGENRGGERRGEGHRAGGRPERRPRPEAGDEVRANNEERRERRPRPERQTQRNEDFRGQRRGEATPMTSGPDNDLAATSDFRPARKPQRPQHGNHSNGENRHHPGGGARNAHGRPARKHGEDRGAQAHGGGERREGNGGNRRGGPSRGGNGQRRERA